MADKTVLFVCTGNTCRSPMAEALYNALFSSDGSRAVSAGLQTSGENISPFAVSALKSRGIRSDESNPYAEHIAKTADETMVLNADAVVGMTAHHAEILKKLFPAYSEKITSFPHGITDPFGGDDETYRFTLNQIETELTAMFKSGENT